MGPFDRFNDRAKRVLALAQDEAIRFNHNYIGTEHLLLGLVREGEGVAARVLDSLGVELSKVRTAVEFIIGRGDSTTSPSEITLSPRTKKVIELAIDEARKLGHSHVGTEHLLLGIVREGEGIASGVLESLGVSLEKIRHQVIATLGRQYPDSAATPHGTGQIDRIDERSKRALAFAQDDARSARAPSAGDRGGRPGRRVAGPHLARGDRRARARGDRSPGRVRRLALIRSWLPDALRAGRLMESAPARMGPTAVARTG